MEKNNIMSDKTKEQLSLSILNTLIKLYEQQENIKIKYKIEKKDSQTLANEFCESK